MVEKYADLLFTFLQRYKDELVESVFQGVDDEDEKKRLQGGIQKLKNIVGDAMTSSDDAPGLSEKDVLLIDVHAVCAWRRVAMIGNTIACSLFCCLCSLAMLSNEGNEL